MNVWKAVEIVIGEERKPTTVESKTLTPILGYCRSLKKVWKLSRIDGQKFQWGKDLVKSVDIC
jgi:hypothetical protein